MTKTIGSLLALAVSTSIALANGGEGDKKNGYQEGKGGLSWKPGSGVTFDGGDEFRLQLTGFVQARWEYANVENDTDINNFDVPRARVMLTGNAFNKDLHYMLTLDGVDDGATSGNGGAVKDAWAQWNFMNEDGNRIGLRFGQSKPFHGLEFAVFGDGLYFVERSLATRVFSEARSRGAWLHGSHAENKFRWNFGAQNGDVANGVTGILEVGEETPNFDNEVTFVANVSWDPLGDMTGGRGTGFEFARQGNLGDVTETRGTIGAGVMVGNGRNLANSFDVDTTQININTAWLFNGGWSLQGEYYMRTDDPDITGGTEEDTSGYYVMGMYTMEKRGDSNVQWGFGLRYSFVETDDTSNFLGGGFTGEVSEISAVLNAFYRGHSCKTQVEYTFQDISPDGGGDQSNHILRVQFQLVF